MTTQRPTSIETCCVSQASIRPRTMVEESSPTSTATCTKRPVTRSLSGCFASDASPKTTINTNGAETTRYPNSSINDLGGKLPTFLLVDSAIERCRIETGRGRKQRNQIAANIVEKGDINFV